MDGLNKENLKIAIEGLKSLNISEEQFDIEDFGGIDGCSREELKHGLIVYCNTVACAVGWCPFIGGLGIDKSDFTIKGKFSYVYYAHRIFGDLPDTDAWDFMFEVPWKKYDNTLEGVIARMEYVYDGKYTDDWDYEDFKQGWHKK